MLTPTKPFKTYQPETVKSLVYPHNLQIGDKGRPKPHGSLKWPIGIERRNMLY